MNRILLLLSVNLVLFGILWGAGELLTRRFFASQRTVSAVGVPIFEAHRSLGFAHKPLVSAENGYGRPTPKILIDRHGFRVGTRSSPTGAQQTRSGPAVLLLGDSFTFGTGLGYEQSFAGRLEERLAPARVHNAGVIGHTVDQYLVMLRETYESIRPTVVVVNLFCERPPGAREARTFPP